MAKYAKGKYALAISDRSGQAFPWRQMVTEWNGAFGVCMAIWSSLVVEAWK